jgi:geranylgeranyl reductase family protein
VLVVGAGPGGSAAAYHLAGQGADVVLIDKERFPRDKVCGDGLTPRAVRALIDMGVDVEDPGFARCDGLRTYGEGRTILELPWPRLRTWPSFGLIRTRLGLDDLLASRAQKAGARFLQATEATAPIREDGWVVGAQVKDEDGAPIEVRARWVVAADGGSSRLASGLGVRRDATRPIGIAARRYYGTTRPFQPFMESFVHLRGDGGLIPGYGWIFFLPDGTVNVGAGLQSTFRDFRHTSARAVFDAFVAGLPPEWGINEDSAVGPVGSGPLPSGLNRRPAAVPGMLLVGDAAGAVNPWNGEGISCAMESGALAAELIGEALAKDRAAIAHLYPVVLRERYGKYYALGSAWARLIGNPKIMRAAVRLGLPRKRLMAFALRVMANLTDGRDGDVEDRLMDALVSLAPVR